MRRSVQRIREFGLGNYLAHKLYKLSPDAYFRAFPRQERGFVDTAYGVAMTANWSDATFRKCVFGGAGTVLSGLLSAPRARPFAFLDVGANQGLFALIAARNPACETVLAFEPVPETYRYLEANAANATGGDRITCLQAAIAAEAGEARITLPDNHSGAASMAARETLDGASVTIKTLDAAALDPMIAGDLELVVKVDVEGFEDVVVPQLLALRAAPRITDIFCEIDLDWVDFDAISGLLTDAGLSEQTRHGGARHFDLLARRPRTRR